MKLPIMGIYIAWQSCTLFCMNTQSVHIPSLPPIHCLAFIDNSTLIVGTSSKCLAIENLEMQRCLIKTFDEHPPCNFVLNNDRTRLAVKRKKDFTIYDLSTKQKLSQIESPCHHYSLAISIDNIPFICCKNKFINMLSSQVFNLPYDTNGFNITCHPHEKIISYIDSSDAIINIDHQGEVVSIYKPNIPSHANIFYPQKEHISSICYSPDGNAIICITQENYILVYDITEKKTMNYLIHQQTDFFTKSILALVDHHGSIFFLDYKKNEDNQNIVHTSSLGSSPIFSTISKKKFDFSPNKLLFALCLDGLCYIKHTPLTILKDFFINRYFLLKSVCNNYQIPVEITHLIMLKAIWPHTDLSQSKD